MRAARRTAYARTRGRGPPSMRAAYHGRSSRKADSAKKTATPLSPRASSGPTVSSFEAPVQKPTCDSSTSPAATQRSRSIWRIRGMGSRLDYSGVSFVAVLDLEASAA
ncbi:hypothetical protein GCM10027070_01960 [Barrientosiimonas humi]